MGSSAATFGSHTDVVSKNTTPMNTVLSSTLVGSSMTSTIDQLNQANVLITSPTLPSQVVSLTFSCPTVYKSDTSYWAYSIIQSNILWNSSLSISTIFTCSMSGSSTISVQFSTDGSGNPVPSWGTIDLANNLLNFSVPYVSSDTTYSFTLVETTTESSYYYNVGVTLNVISCKISNWMTCVSTDFSKWATCNSGYTLNNYAWTLQTTTSNTTNSTTNNTTTSDQQIYWTERTVAVTSISILGVGVVAAALTSILTFSSPRGMWSVINLFQTLTILLLTGAYFPEETTISFANLIQYTNFSFDFIPYSSLGFVDFIMDWFNLPVNGDLMAKVGLKSGSTLFNNTSLLINILLVLLLHLMFLVLRCILCAWWTNKQFVKFVINKIYKLLTVGLYLRLILEAYQFLLIWSTDEIHFFKTSTNSEITSLAISLLVFIILNIFTVFIFVLSIKQIYKGTAESSDNSQTYFDEIFDGTKDTKYSKFYSFMFILRKALIVMLMLYLSSLNISIKVGLFVLVQSIYYLYLILVRPLENRKDNLIDVINETLILLLASMLFKYNKEPDWTSSSKMVFFMSISIVCITVGIICIGKYDIWLFSFSWLTG